MISGDESDMIPYGFYGYHMTETGEIELKALRNTQATDVQALGKNGGSIAANGKTQELIFNGSALDLVIDNNTALHLVSSKACETYEGYKNFAIDEQDVDVLVIYSGRTVQEIYVIDGQLIEKDVYAYYNGTELQISGSKAYIPMYVDGELWYYTWSAELGTIDEMHTLEDGVYQIDLKGAQIVAMTSLMTESWHRTMVASVRADGTAFTVMGTNVNEVNATCADNVEIYDLTEGGARVDGVSKGDTILYCNNAAAQGSVVTHIWILKHYTSAPVVNDAPATAEVVFTKNGNTWRIDFTGLRSNDVVEIVAYKYMDGAYGVYETYSFIQPDGDSNGFTQTYDFDAEMVFKVMVNGEYILTTDTYVFVK